EAAIPPGSREARVPHHGPLRGLPDYGALPDGGTGGIDVGDSGGQHGADGSSRALRPRAARGTYAVEGEPGSGACGASRAGGTERDAAPWDRSGELYAA